MEQEKANLQPEWVLSVKCGEEFILGFSFYTLNVFVASTLVAFVESNGFYLNDVS